MFISLSFLSRRHTHISTPKRVSPPPPFLEEEESIGPANPRKRKEKGGGGKRKLFYCLLLLLHVCESERERRRRRSVNLGQILSPPLPPPPPPPPISSSHSFLSHTHRERSRKENPFLSIPGLGRQVSKENKSPLKMRFYKPLSTCRKSKCRARRITTSREEGR